MKNNMLRAKIIERFGVYSEFAKAVGEDESIVSRVVCGRREIAPEKKSAWAKVLFCEPADIFEG